MLPEPLPKKQKVTSTKDVVAEKKTAAEASAPPSPTPDAQRELRSKRKHDVAKGNCSFDFGFATACESANNLV